MALRAKKLCIVQGSKCPQNRQIETQFEKTNIFNLLLNDINKTHSEFKYKYIVYVHVFVQGDFFGPTKPCQDTEGTCDSVQSWNICIATRKRHIYMENTGR